MIGLVWGIFIVRFMVIGGVVFIGDCFIINYYDYCLDIEDNVIES